MTCMMGQSVLSKFADVPRLREMSDTLEKRDGL